MARKNKNKKPEYVVICREFNRAAARIDITVIDKGVTDHLLNQDKPNECSRRRIEAEKHDRLFLSWNDAGSGGRMATPGGTRI